MLDQKVDRNSETFLKIMRNAFNLLLSNEKKHLLHVSLILSLAGIFDVIAISSIMPVITLILEPGRFNDYKILTDIKDYLSAFSLEQITLLLGICAIFLLIFSTFMTIYATWKINDFGAAIQSRMGAKLIELLLKTKYSWFLEQNNASLVRFLHSDIARWGRDFIQRIVSIAQHAFNILLPVFLLFYLAPFAGLICLIIVAIVSLAMIHLALPAIKNLSAKSKILTDDLVQISDHSMNGIKDIKVFCAEEKYISKFSHIYQKASFVGAKLALFQLLPSILLLLFGQISLLLIVISLWMLGYTSGEITSQIALIILVSSRIIPSTNRIVGLYGSLWNSIPWVMNLIKIEAETSNLQEYKIPEEAKETPDNWLKLEFKNVGFFYTSSQKQSLIDINLCIEKNKSYGIVGASGSGKSTLIDLLIGLHTPQRGNITIDGQHYTSLASQKWRNNIGYVPQKPYFFDKTLRENIALGSDKFDVDAQKLKLSIELSNSAEFVYDLKDGLDTKIGDRGVRLSGGQLQRIAIARAIYQQPKILILDEASSNLDPISQIEYQKCLKKLSGSITIISIAHRIETLKGFTTIFHIDSGKLVASGNYDQILKNVT